MNQDLNLTARFSRVSVTKSCLAALLLVGGARVQAVTNTANTFTTGTDLTLPGDWSLGTVPTVSNDAVFSSTSPNASLTLNASETFGSLDDTHTGVTTAISNTSTTAVSTLTLGGSGDLGNGVSGANTEDLIYVAGAANTVLTVAGGGTEALNVTLGQSGNFDVGTGSTLNIGTLKPGSTLDMGGNTLTLTGAGTVNIGGSGVVRDTVQNGTLQLGANNIIGSGGAFTVATSATFDLNSYSPTLANVYFFGNVINSSNTPSTLTLSQINVSGSLTEAASFSGALNFNLSDAFDGNSNITFSGNFTNTGNITFNQTAGSAKSAPSIKFYGVINNTGTITNQSTGTTSALLGQTTGSTSYVGSNVTSIIENTSTSVLQLGGDNTLTAAQTGLTGGFATGTGTVLIENGTLLLTNPHALGTGNAITLGNTTPATSGTLAIGTPAVTNVANSYGTGAHVTGATYNSSTGLASGGTVTGTNTQGLGMLTMAANSTLSFGTSKSTQVFGTFNDVGNYTLNVTGYTSSASAVAGISGTDTTNGTNNDDRLIFFLGSGNTTGLSTTLLSDITFAGVADASEISLGGGFFEVDPISTVPEPSTWVGSLLLVGFVAVHERRRFSRLGVCLGLLKN